MANDFSYPDAAAKTADLPPGVDPEKMSLSMGPSHPSTHGVLRIQFELDGEMVTKADPVIGYLHRGDEKIAENMTYNQFVPYTDRLDYLAPLANNMAYAIAVERLAGLVLPPRGQAIRVLTAEMARVSSHLMGLGAYGIDVGAWSVFMYCFEEREKLYKLFEELTGARFTTSYTRIGGVSRDVPDGWIERVNGFCDQFLPILDEKVFLSRCAEGRRHHLRPDRPEPPRVRRAQRPAQGPALLGLRAVRVRRAGRLEGRLLRPLPLPRRGDEAVHPHHPPDREEFSRR